MSNLVQRIIMFFFFIPLILVLILAMPWANHLALQFLMLLVTGGLSLEIGKIFGIWPWKSPKEIDEKPIVPRILRTIAILVCGITPLLGRMAGGFGFLPVSVIALAYVLPILWIYASQVIKSQTVPFELFSRNTTAYLMVLMYPALGMSYFLAVMFLPDASILLLVFLGSVFLNDTFAYLAGRLLGKRSTKPFRVSPNKTAVGFIFGFIASPLIMILGWFYRPGLFPAGPWAALAIGILVGLFTIIGDLFESGLKRSFGVKDSGEVIMGRGGLLDSLDSLIFTSPIFYFSYVLLNHLPLM